MRGLALVAVVSMGLAACDGQMYTQPGPKIAQACAKPFERTVSFTAAQAGDRLVVEALGPDCTNPALLGRVFDQQGRLVYAEMTSGRWMMNPETYPVGGGTAQGAVDTLYDIGGANSMNLPAWTGSTPSQGNYGAYEVLVPKIAYERLRQLNRPTLIKRGGGESGMIYIYDPDATMAIAVAKYAV